LLYDNFNGYLYLVIYVIPDSFGLLEGLHLNFQKARSSFLSLLNFVRLTFPRRYLIMDNFVRLTFPRRYLIMDSEAIHRNILTRIVK
jgi:hypothetical protein